MIADEVAALAAAREKGVKERRLRIDEDVLTADRVEALKAALAAHPGTCTASLDVVAPGYVASVKLPNVRVAATEKLVDEVERLGARVAYL